MVADTNSSLWRRRLLVGGAVAAGALGIGVWRLLAPRDRLTPPAGLAGGPGTHVLSAWLLISRDGIVTVQVPRQEMGQGVTTALPMLVAEELDADWATVRFAQAPVDPVYANATLIAAGVPFRPDDHGWLATLSRRAQAGVGTRLGVQATGGSTSVRDAWEPLRLAGAAARAMLLRAGAERFGVALTECTTAEGWVHHRASGRQLAYGDLAEAAARMPVPSAVPLKAPQDFRLLGRSRARLDVPAKVDGSAIFGSDIKVPGMCQAAIVQCPVPGGRLRHLDDSAARRLRGIRAVIRLEGTSTSPAAVAVVADRWWRAQAALASLRIEWDEGTNGAHDTTEQRRRYESRLAREAGRIHDEAGDPDAGLSTPGKLVEASYHVPYVAHAAMEPLNCTALWRTEACEVWVGSQAPTLVRWFAAKAAGLGSDRVTVHTPYLGGGFGRRAEMDVVVQAVAIARSLPGTPVQLLWSREEDTRHDVYRPMASARLRAALDGSGQLVAWHTRIASQSCTGSLTARLLPAAASDLMRDKTTTEGAFDLPYFLPHRRTEHLLAHEPLRVGFWRSVGHSHNAFFAECFLDECAAAAGQDPLAFRLGLLSHAPRHRAVLEKAALASGWGGALPPGHGRGIALAESFGALVAQVVEVRVDGSRLEVRRVVCAVDCGFAVNPDAVVAQMEGAIVFGLSAALHGEITVSGGRVQQGNFHDQPILTLAETPAIEVHVVNSGIEHLAGAGEPGTPPVAPALCNAIHAATGRRIRALPVRL